jgi:hypothetical protein
MAVAVAPSASADQNGYNAESQTLRTTGNVRCVVSAEKAACEQVAGFPAAPANQTGGHWQVASVDAAGKFSWAEAGIGGSGEEIAMVNGNPYRFHGWRLLLTTEGTRLTNIKSVHGMNISIDGKTVTPY